MSGNLEKYDKLVTAALVIIAFVLGIGWWFAEEKSEPVYLSKIDKLMFDKDNKAPKFVLTLPDKLIAKTKDKNEEIVVDVVPDNAPKVAQAADEGFSLDKLLSGVPSVMMLPAKAPTNQLKFLDLDEMMVEITPKGKKLPKVSSDGRQPWIEYGHTVKTQPNFKKISLVISGLGFDINAIAKIAQGFSSEASLSFTPYTPHPKEAILKARESGHETYVDLLLSSKDFLKEDTGPLSINLNLSSEEAKSRFHDTLAMSAPIGGLIVRDGIANDSNAVILSALLGEAKNRGLLIVDATSGEGVNKIKIDGLARRKADIVIDKDMSKEMIESALKKAENIAFDKGQVLIVSDPKPIAVMALYDWIQTFSPQVSYEEAKEVDISKPFALVPLSNLVVE